jgi:dephospho-CoA kinase
MALIVGLTGGIATGKSTVAGMFINYGIPVIDTDKISFDLLRNRKKLGRAIFNDNIKRKKLNNIIHPKVKAITLSEIKKEEELGAEIVVIDVPLLFETNFVRLVNKSIVVYTTPKLQVERLIGRDSIKKEYALLKIESQIPIEDKVKLADYVIDNSCSILETKKAFNKIMEKLEVL